jgi:endonuclease YncB( thermonuclease family)
MIKDRKENFGRYLGAFILRDGANLNDWLVKLGYAVAYLQEDDARAA